MKENMKNLDQKKQIAISVKNVSKQFSIPHERINSIKVAFINLFKKKSYENFYALKDVSFQVKKGEFFGIIGRNGSGKSTLLKILAGVYTSDKGSVDIDGRISPFLELGIGFNPELSGRDNIYLNGTVLGLTEKEIDSKFDSIVAFSELERFIDQKLKNYSSGMSVRLAFSVSIHANRDILLMDEVLAVGDSNFQSKCINEFIKYKEKGKTVVLVTHDIGTVQRYCDRAMLIREGKIEMIGDADEVANEYVYQNMSDEERRFVAEQKRLEDVEKSDKIKKEEEIKKTTEEEQKNKVAEITGVEFLDKNGKAKNVFETGEAMDIKINFRVNKKIDVMNIGVGIHSVISGMVLAYNTQVDKYTIDFSHNRILLHLDDLPLLKGEYFVNINCFGSEPRSPFDYKVKSKNFKIYSKYPIEDYGGILYISHNWK